MTFKDTLYIFIKANKDKFWITPTKRRKRKIFFLLCWRRSGSHKPPWRRRHLQLLFQQRFIIIQPSLQTFITVLPHEWIKNIKINIKRKSMTSNIKKCGFIVFSPDIFFWDASQSCRRMTAHYPPRFPLWLQWNWNAVELKEIWTF